MKPLISRKDDNKLFFLLDGNVVSQPGAGFMNQRSSGKLTCRL